MKDFLAPLWIGAAVSVIFLGMFALGCLVGEMLWGA